MSLFVDTSAWYAALDSGDTDNAPAMRILGAGEPLVTTDHVLVETWRLVAQRIGRSEAERFLDNILGGAAGIESVSQSDLEMAREISGDFPDQDFSIVDRTSFVVMRRLGVLRVATFDHHFAVYRFGPGREQAFTVLR